MPTTNSGAKAQRRWKRFEVEIPIRLEALINGARCSFHSTGSDISQGGLSAFMPRDVELGVTVTLVLCLPYARENLTLRGIIRNRSGFHYGIEFVDCSAFHTQIISQNCRALEIPQ
ncbi:MAG TPA: PilZ domain-containing protein [Terriglobales bacterium]|nr:PilZ domain-containing protein [Terriglobales bacterium]